MTHRRTHVATERIAHLPGLDGLRAAAVLAVVLYHAQLPWAPGGFLGVDVFFVISGYLINALLLSQIEEHGAPALGAFWLRRAARLLPALLLTVAAAVPLTALLLPEQLDRLRGDAPAALAFLSNWHFVADQRPYSEAFDRPSPLLHTWSLAIEGQFYLIWPLLLMACYGVGGRRGVLYASLAGAAASMLAMALLHQAGASAERLYYGTDTHAAGLLIGAALAAAWRPWREPERARGGWLADLAGLAALLALGWAFWRVYEYQELLYRGGFALIALLSALAVAAAVHPRSLLARLLGLAPLRWIGERSYGIYLYHWPVFVLTPPLRGPLATAALLGQLALIALLAELSYRYVERPLRRAALARLSGRARPGARGGAAHVATAALAGCAVAIALGAWLALDSRDTAASFPAALTTPLAGIAPAPAPPPGLRLASSLGARAPVRAGVLASSADPAPPPSGPGSGMVRHVYKSNRVLAIGDSVLVGAAPELLRRFAQLEVDAQVGRQLKSAIELLRERRAAGQLGNTVVVHLGTNGYVSDEQVGELLETLADVRRVVVVNVRVPKRWEAHNNEVLARAVAGHANAVLVDWYAATEGRPELLARDGVHPQPAGRELYADLIIAQLGGP